MTSYVGAVIAAASFIDTTLTSSDLEGRKQKVLHVCSLKQRLATFDSWLTGDGKFCFRFLADQKQCVRHISSGPKNEV
jgi:hypothetical protein